MRLLCRPFATVLLLFCLVTAAHAYDTAPVRDPEALSFSPSRLERIAAWQQTQVDAGAFSGAVTAIARNGKVAYLRAVGFRDRAKTDPLKSEAIFWIASMSKPITSVAAMMLVEEGKLDLAAPVYQYIPELKDVMVAVETRDPVTGKTELAREPQKRTMTVEDLLRHTAGLTFGIGSSELDHQLYKSLYGASGVYRRDKTLADFVSALAKLPLAHQPGEVWDYGPAIDVLARVIEVASGQPFDQFLQTRLFNPLGMVDTGFFVPEAKLSRLVDRPLIAGPPDSVTADVSKPTRLFSGGGGLASTASDYLRFCQMLLNGGELDGVRILSPETVRRMTTNTLPPDIRFAGFATGLVGPLGGSTWGLGFAIRNNAAFSAVPGSVGSFNWLGAGGTFFWIDPAEQLIAVQLIQVAPGSGTPFTNMFRNLTYGAFRVPDSSVTARATPVTVGAAALAAYAGTYTFASTSSRDRQEPSTFGGLGLDVGMEHDLLKVHAPIPNAPAARAGVMPNDIITHLDDEPTQGMSLGQAIDRMRGPVGTRIRLKIVRKGHDEPIELTIVRASIRPRGTDAELQISVKDDKLQVEVSGAPLLLDFEKGAPVAAVPMSSDEFFVDDGDHTRLAFLHDGAGPASQLVLNPGPWQITGRRMN
jgi:CubicO group peptidase (beta-lactamase class C family)